MPPILPRNGGNRTRSAETSTGRLQAFLATLDSEDSEPYGDWRRVRDQISSRQAARLETTARRVRRCELFRRTVPATGLPRPVWCVELRQRFESLTEAARFASERTGLHQTASNVCRSIAGAYRCGGLTWDYFAPERHGGLSMAREAG